MKKTLTTFLIVALSFTFAAVGTKAFAQDAEGSGTKVESDQLEATILQLREQLMKLEKSRASVDVSSGDAVASSSVILTRSGNGVFGGSQTVNPIPSLSHREANSSVLMPYSQAQPRATTLPSNSLWIEQPMLTVAAPSILSEAITSPVPPVYNAPVTEWLQPAPVVQQPLVVQQAPAPQTIIVNIYQQAPAAQNSFFPPILAPIYGPPPVQVVAPRRRCCLCGRR